MGQTSDSSDQLKQQLQILISEHETTGIDKNNSRPINLDASFFANIYPRNLAWNNHCLWGFIFVLYDFPYFRAQPQFRISRHETNRCKINMQTCFPFLLSIDYVQILETSTSIQWTNNDCHTWCLSDKQQTPSRTKSTNASINNSWFLISYYLLLIT